MFTVERLVKTVWEGSISYDLGKATLDSAIEEYNQAVFDLTLSIVGGICIYKKILR